MRNFAVVNTAKKAQKCRGKVTTACKIFSCHGCLLFGCFLSSCQHNNQPFPKSMRRIHLLYFTVYAGICQDVTQNHNIARCRMCVLASVWILERESLALSQDWAHSAIKRHMWSESEGRHKPKARAEKMPSSTGTRLFFFGRESKRC